MAFANNQSGPQQQFQHAPFAGLNTSGPSNASRADDPQFDIFEWYPQYQSCQKYFLDHAQHAMAVQAVAAFLNITLPFQREANPISSFSSGYNGPGPSFGMGLNRGSGSRTNWISLVPYLRRLVATGLDIPGVLHGFFGDDWAKGVGPLHEQERRNYLFAAKSGGWASVKKDYDMSPHETVPFLRPLQNALNTEIEGAEKTWSEWLAMEDWMVGPRAPEQMDEGASSRAGRSRPQ
ncbi:MAG: methionine-synthesizing 5- methyltetrahydropteroyltriglutamate--homocysteine methyltransferase [Chaenotheca gracillima]|nr:MAG: methionine-synthesizing 5- methyltetrahydropteroyltriglutamate--homocysteine methyltransferase [Chaenotheca gracillima]